jgi:hypothetical protein
MRWHGRQHIPGHARQGGGRYARNTQVLLESCDEVFLIQQSQPHDGFTDRSPIALLQSLSGLKALLG